MRGCRWFNCVLQKVTCRWRWLILFIFNFHFQFNHEFKPTRLCNWEVPRWHRSRPIQPKSTTKIISNDRGHLLPGVTRWIHEFPLNRLFTLIESFLPFRPSSSPWGQFKSTWQLPDRISKQQAIALHSPVIGSTRWNKPRQKSTKPKSAETQVWSATRRIGWNKIFSKFFFLPFDFPFFLSCNPSSTTI